jgi:hypothetical protein
MSFLFDLVYDWIIHVVPAWLWWILMTPLLAFAVFLIAQHFYPGLISN